MTGKAPRSDAQQMAEQLVEKLTSIVDWESVGAAETFSEAATAIIACALTEATDDTQLETTRQLDAALHGAVTGRPESPEEVWRRLLDEVTARATDARYLDTLVEKLRVLTEATETAEADGPPGVWLCVTCGFVAMKALLRACDGAVGIDRRDVQDVCPNDGTSLRRQTWKEACEAADRIGLEQTKRAESAEAQLTEARR